MEWFMYWLNLIFGQNNTYGGTVAQNFYFVKYVLKIVQRLHGQLLKTWSARVIACSYLYLVAKLKVTSASG